MSSRTPLFGRRRSLQLAAAAALSFAAPRAPSSEHRRIRAVAFDGFAVFDPRPVAELAARLVPDQGAALMDLWRTRQFEYTWLRTLVGRYADFWQVTGDALRYAVGALKLDLGPADRDRLLQAVLEMTAWPDAPDALERLKRAGHELVFLANPTAAMLDRWLGNAGLRGLFGPHLTTDRVRAFKPDRRAYAMGPEALRLPVERIAFAAFGGWDAAGAKAFGYRTFWVDRSAAPEEQLGFAADGIGRNLAELADFVDASG